MAGTLFIKELRRQKRELAYQLQKAKHQLATSKDELVELASEKKKREEETAQWRSIATRRDDALKFTNEDFNQLDYCTEIADLERSLDEVTNRQARMNMARRSLSPWLLKVVVTIASSEPL